MPARLPEVIAALLSPEAYPHAAPEVELVQTHISYVMLAGAYAYKVKKPLDLGFLDYRTLEQRRFMCEEEVRLNRRLCHGVYLGVVAIVRAAGGYRIDAEGEPVEYAVRMRRVPRARMLSERIARGETSGDEVAQVARAVAVFHERAAADSSLARFGRPPALRFNWDESLAQAAPFIGQTIAPAAHAAIAAWVDASLARDAALFEARASDGRVRDCHGDLRCDAVALGDDGVCIMDCIEFNDRLRYGDVAGDIGFLAMDLDARGRPDLADEVMSAYLGVADDETLPCVLDFYRGYRAFVRGKVESIAAAQPELTTEEASLARGRARTYFALARDYARAAPAPVLVAFTGLPGTGKSALAAALACRIGAAFVRSDAVRRRLAGAPAPSPVPYGSGAYAAAARARVYDAQHAAAAAHLATGRPVVLDATYSRRAQRDAARRLAEAAGVPLLVVAVGTAEHVVGARLARREGAAAGTSDARWETYLAQRREFEPPDEVALSHLLRVDGATPLHRNVARARAALRRLSR